jgi:Ca2+-binding EF-hand superfamily protein
MGFDRPFPGTAFNFLMTDDLIFPQNKIDEWIAATDFDSDGKITLEEFKLGMAGNSLVDDV